MSKEWTHEELARASDVMKVSGCIKRNDASQPLRLGGVWHYFFGLNLAL